VKEAAVEELDVVVLGTGAAGLTAALAAAEHGARVGVFEKADLVGGTSAWSGGMLWIPCNHHGAAAGLPDSREDALTYLAALSNGLIDPELAEAFVDAGPQVVRWLETHTPVRFAVIPGFPDYHPEHPGGKPGGGRSLECPLFAFAELGEWAAKVSTGRQLAAGASAANTTVSETALGRGAPQGVPEPELARRRIRDERGAGQALVGSLLKGCLDRGIVPRTGCRAVDLVLDGDRVTGVRLSTGGTGTTVVGARRGVILATGGFEWDAGLVRSFLRGPMTRPVSTPTNTGDGLKMAMRAGAALGNMREAWWLPTIDVRDASGAALPWMVNGERTRPHTIIVNRRGVRFANEAANYNAFGAAFHHIDVTGYEYANLPAWMLLDQHYLERYGLAGHRGDRPCPDWLTSAPTVAALAGALGIPADALEATVARWNAACADGDDPDFGRGRSAHDRWWGDPAISDGPRSTLGPLDSPPYYAVEVHSGTLGTKGGPRTTVEGQVIDLDGAPIPGLYAAGNVMASPMGMTYGGAGGTLGPGVTFGFLAGRAAACSSPSRSTPAT
jgi:succinate dehydrogenase/fumarate reductase flavoprotein subunit